MNEQPYHIWLEFEEWKEDSSEQNRDFFNMKLIFQDGREYALNVWTFKYAEHLRGELREEQSCPVFALGPDLIVEVAERRPLEVVAEKLVKNGLLKESWLVCVPSAP